MVACGGDGTLTECLAGLATRARMEAGIDPDDPDSVLPFLDMRVGLIPAGEYITCVTPYHSHLNLANCNIPLVSLYFISFKLKWYY